MMKRMKCSDATERKWNQRKMLENEKELRDGEHRGGEDQWKQSAEELKWLSDPQKWTQPQICQQGVRGGLAAEEAEKVRGRDGRLTERSRVGKKQGGAVSEAKREEKEERQN